LVHRKLLVLRDLGKDIVAQQNNIVAKQNAQLIFMSEELNRAILSDQKYQNPMKLNRYEYRVFSQNGEDGIIEEIFRRVGTTNRYFVEFGAADGYENNTVFLLYRAWKGFWMDGDANLIRRANEHFKDRIGSGQIATKQAFITAENIEGLFQEAKVPKEFDFLSIDIDRNDYYVWRNIQNYSPRVVVIEYNPLLPPSVSWVIPYDPKAWWDGTSHTSASLKALELLGKEKGYSLVGCNTAGVNAFFVRNDLVGDKFAAPFTAENHYEPSRYHLNAYDSNHPRVP
jgi:hypothetical protein